MGWLLQAVLPFVLDRLKAYFSAVNASQESWLALQNFITVLQSHGLQYVSDIQQFTQQNPATDPQPKPQGEK